MCILISFPEGRHACDSLSPLQSLRDKDRATSTCHTRDAGAGKAFRQDSVRMASALQEGKLHDLRVPS